MRLIISILLMCLSLNVSATVVTTVWPFSSSSIHANMTRAIVDKANSIQKKYEFRLEFKPGAGGLIATKYVNSTDIKNIKILSTTSSFYIRKILYNDDYRVEDFQPLVFHCYQEPMVLYSSKYKTLSQISRKNETSFSIGVNPGSITSAFANELAGHVDLPLNQIPYPGAVEVMRDVSGNHLDLGIGFLSSVEAYPNLSILAITGKDNFGKYTTLNSSSFEVFTGTYMIVIPSFFSELTKNEISSILHEAINSSEVEGFCSKLYGKVPKFNFNERDVYYRKLYDLWKKSF